MQKMSLWMTLVLFSVLLGACAAPTVHQPQTGALKVLAAESFLGDIAQNIAGERLTVETLIPPGVDPHEFEPTPQDLGKISQSQILIVNGLGYEDMVKKNSRKRGQPADSARCQQRHLPKH